MVDHNQALSDTTPYNTQTVYMGAEAGTSFLSWVNRERTRRVPGKGQSWVAAVQRQLPHV